jgi:heme-degrading monooxygenase HmoA
MYVIVWEFKVKPGSITEFESAYGAAGDWAQFFSRGVGYLGTRLFHEVGEQGSYVTFDRWASRQDYENFQRQHGEQYRQLDEQFELMTDTETMVGAFEKSNPPEAASAGRETA